MMILTLSEAAEGQIAQCHWASLNKILVSRAKDSVFLKEPSSSFLGEPLTKMVLDSAVYLTNP